MSQYPDDTPQDDETRRQETAPTTRIPNYEPPTRSATESPSTTPGTATPGTATPGATTPGATTLTGTAVKDDVVAPPVRRQMRMRTLVVGIVLLAIAVLSNLNLTTSIDFRLGTVVLALMIGCGVLLIVGASRRE